MIVRVYVIGPLETHGSIEENKADAERVGRKIIQLGGWAVVPHSFNLNAPELQPRAWWLRGDLGELSTCHVAMCRLHWERSIGSLKEVKHCGKFGIPLYYDERNGDWLSLEMFIKQYAKIPDPHEGTSLRHTGR